MKKKPQDGNYCSTEKIKPAGMATRTSLPIPGLNDKKTADYELWTDEWKKHKAAGKWKDTKGYGMSKKGHIVLQDHGSEAWFINIKIREL